MGHWYNEQAGIRAEVEVRLPDGTVLTANNSDRSPVGGWEWHTEPPAWWVETQEQSNE